MLQKPLISLSRLLLVLLLVVPTGCSFTRLGYQNLDWFVGWKMRDYVSLNREQKRWLSTELKSQLAWHCNSELPRYRPHLLAMLDQAMAPSVQAEYLTAFIPVWEQEAQRTLTQLVPTATGLMQQLDDRQVTAIERNLARQNREMREKYLLPDVTAQNSQRSERARERLETWLGRLSPEQQQRVDSWATEMEGHTQIWLENRESWQARFLELLAQRDNPDIEDSMRKLVLEPQPHWTEAYRLQRERSSEQMAAMVADVLSLADTRQRRHLERRASGLIQDLDNIRCAAQS